MRKMRSFFHFKYEHQPCGKWIPLSSVLCTILLACFAVGGIETDAAQLTRIGGWAWSPNIGWINHQNAILDKDTKDKKGAYGVLMDPGIDVPANKGLLTGWSWSANAGWICWGTTCETLAPSYGTYKPLRVDGTLKPTRVECPTPQIPPLDPPPLCTVSGWIKLIGYKNNGWISLSKATSDSVPGASSSHSYTVNYDSGKNEFSGWAWGGAKLGWISFSGSTLYDTKYKAGSPDAGLPVCIRGLVPADPTQAKNSSNNCLNSVDTTNVAQPVPPTKWKTHYLGAWLQVKGGNMASTKGINADAPPPFMYDQSNTSADYLVISGKSNSSANKILQFDSACKKQMGADCKNFGLIPDYALEGALTFPLATSTKVIIKRGSSQVSRTKFRSKSTFLDVDALTTSGTPNKFGKIVSTVATLDSITDLDNNSGGKIYVVDGDLTIDEDANAGRLDWMFLNGAAGKSGSRTIVVKGDLTIKRNILYEATQTSRLKQLASVAWIVLARPNGTGGNIIIEHCIAPSIDSLQSGALINEVSGFFFAEHTISTGGGRGSVCVNSDPYKNGIAWLKSRVPEIDTDTQCNLMTLTSEEVKACNRIKVLKDTNTDIPLVVHGSMIAKSFNFQRVYGGADAPSEQIINDGRAFVSVPPGLEDFFSAFPSL